jgi:hypothetical protein
LCPKLRVSITIKRVCNLHCRYSHLFKSSKGASLIKTYLIKTNLQGANLDEALCTGAILTRSNLQEAHLNGTYFNGADLTRAALSNAKYNNKTRFDASFNLVKAGLKKVGEVAIAVSPAPTQKAELETPAPVIDLTTLSLTVEDLLLMFQGERILFLKGRLDKGFRDHD